MTNLLSPIYWGALLSIVISLFLLAVGFITSGIPDHLSFLEESIGATSFYSLIFITLLYSLRYYLLIYLNAFNNDQQKFKSLPSTLRVLIFVLMSVITLFCLLSVGAIFRFGVSITLISLILLSLVTLLAWLAHWILSQTGNWQKIGVIFGGAEAILLIISFVVRDMIVTKNENTENALPILAFVVMLIFSHELMKHHINVFKTTYQDLKKLLLQ
jgi:hypothetical protein